MREISKAAVTCTCAQTSDPTEASASGVESLGFWLSEGPKLSNAWTNALPVGVIESVDVSNAVAWLVSDEARDITGTVMPVDAGLVNKR